MLAGLVIVITGGDATTRRESTPRATRSPSSAFINEEIGVVPDGIEIDGRDGTEPPEVENAVLEEAAGARGLRASARPRRARATPTSTIPTCPKVEYETDPPTSGDHYGNGTETASGALADGAYAEFPPVGRYVHSMEHGRVIIHYSPDLPEEDQLAIKGVFEESPAGVILIPNPEMDVRGRRGGVDPARNL